MITMGLSSNTNEFRLYDNQWGWYLLIFTQIPKYIATRSSVRFNIGMDDSGGDGRLRTRLDI
jgi:hypothetical protein